eukprot:1536487-Amphidinium_carterae.1
MSVKLVSSTAFKDKLSSYIACFILAHSWGSIAVLVILKLKINVHGWERDCSFSDGDIPHGFGLCKRLSKAGIQERSIPEHY